MPWYYAGPEAKPVGPVSVEELHACRARGIVQPGTYVIEQTGGPGENLAWKRYQDVFPASPSLPILPPVPPAAPLHVPPIFHPPAPPVAAPQPHPLFPSAAPVSSQHPVFTPAARPDPYYHNVRPTNTWCVWGFWLALTGFFFSFACGLGSFLALPALILCFVGLVQVHKHREQGGQGMAIAGLILSCIALLISFFFIVSLAMPILKAHGLTITEQTSNDTE